MGLVVGVLMVGIWALTLGGFTGIVACKDGMAVVLRSWFGFLFSVDLDFL